MKRPPLTWDGEFESGSLQRRVCEPSVPQWRTADRGPPQHARRRARGRSQGSRRGPLDARQSMTFFDDSARLLSRSWGPGEFEVGFSICESYPAAYTFSVGFMLQSGS